jgi:hypothetical protein
MERNVSWRLVVRRGGRNVPWDEPNRRRNELATFTRSQGETRGWDFSLRERNRRKSAPSDAIGGDRRYRTESAPSDGIGAIGRNRGSGAIGRNRESGASGGPPRPDGADPRRVAAVQRPTSYLPAGCDAESDDPAGRSGVVAFCQEHPRLDGAGGLHHDRVRELVVEALLRRALVGRVEQIDLIDEDDEPDDGSDRRQDVDDLGQ